MKQILTKLLFSILVGCALFTPQLTQAQTGIELVVEAGFDEIAVDEEWVPITITAANQGAMIDGMIEVRTGNNGNMDRYTAPIVLPTQSRKQITLYIAPTGQRKMIVNLLDAGGSIVTSETTTISRSVIRQELMYGVLSDEDVDLDVLRRVTKRFTNAEVAYLNPEALPDKGVAWSSFDILVVSHLDSEKLSAETRTHIKQWVETGGYLVVTGGLQAKQTAAAFADLLPVTVGETVSTESLNNLAGQLVVDVDSADSFLVTQTQLRKGEIILRNGDQPILSVARQGQGRVFYLALDPDLAPLSTSRDFSIALWENALPDHNLPFWELSRNNDYSLERASEIFSALALPSALSLGLFLGLYVIVIGPLNYFILKRLKRRELAWLTIPLVIGVFLAFSYLRGFQIRGSDILINEIGIAVGSANSDTMDVRSVIGLYAPRRGNYDIEFSEESLISPRDTYMLGEDNNDAYIEWGNRPILRNFRIDLADVQSVNVESYQAMPAFTGEVGLHTKSNELVVDLTNQSTLNFTGATLYLGSEVIQLGDFEAGDRIDEMFSVEASSISRMKRVLNANGPQISMSLSNNVWELSQQIAGNSTIGYAYNEPKTELRRNLVEAALPYYDYGGSSPSLSVSSQRILLFAWSDEQLIDIDVVDKNIRQNTTMLYIIELPLVAADTE